MDIGEAVKALKEGKKVRRSAWDLKVCIYKDGYPNYIPDKIVGIYNNEGNIIQSFVSVFHIDDILADDWEIIE